MNELVATLGNSKTILLLNPEDEYHQLIHAAHIARKTGASITGLFSDKMNFLIEALKHHDFQVYLGFDLYKSSILFFLDKTGYVYTCRSNTPERELVFGHVLKSKKDELFNISEFHSTKLEYLLNKEIIDEFTSYCCTAPENIRVICPIEDDTQIEAIAAALGYLM